MIPRTIHYVWLGPKPMPRVCRRYVDGWKTIMPGWEIKKWDESTFPIDTVPFVKDAYGKRLYAFAADYIRIKVLHDFGGIYLDTDEEVIRPLDRFLAHNAFFGRESAMTMQGSVIGCEARNPVVRRILDIYDTIPAGTTEIIGSIIMKALALTYPGFTESPADTFAEPEPGIAIYPSECFNPDLATLTDRSRTWTIHHARGSWLPPGHRLKQRIYAAIVGNPLLRPLYISVKR